MARLMSLGALLLLGLMTGCASTWSCHYDGYTGTNVTCSYQGVKKFSTEVGPPVPPIKEGGE